MDWADSTGWLLFGLLGNLVFSCRFLVQWIASERAGASVVPTLFWHLSLVGSLVLLAYALHRRDPSSCSPTCPTASSTCATSC
jgi:lipid-A-disaccharide synthase-like uncharacterized protein